jgi:ABC-type sugar transport system permease subunit
VRSGAHTSAAAPLPWRRVLRRHLALLLVIKFVALAMLWAWFFSPAHRILVDARATGRQLALLRPDAPADGAAAPREGEQP